MELTFLQLMQFRYLKRQQEAEDTFWKMRLKQFTMTAYTAPGILNEIEQPLATEDTTTIEQESVVPYPVINTLDTKSIHQFGTEDVIVKELISIRTILTSSDRMITGILVEEEELKELSEERKISLRGHIEDMRKSLDKASSFIN